LTATSALDGIGLESVSKAAEDRFGIVYWMWAANVSWTTTTYGIASIVPRPEISARQGLVIVLVHKQIEASEKSRRIILIETRFRYGFGRAPAAPHMVAHQSRGSCVRILPLRPTTGYRPRASDALQNCYGLRWARPPRHGPLPTAFPPPLQWLMVWILVSTSRSSRSGTGTDLRVG
jgi:hypothetical protein